MIQERAYKFLAILISLVISLSVSAQYSSEDELKDAANKFFEEENYLESLPLFAQLLSLYPKDADYSYKYGASLLFGSRDKSKVLQYLKFATGNSNVDPLAFYFLGRAHQNDYDFDLAIANYIKYKGKSSAKDHKKYEVDRHIEMCNNGKKLLRGMVSIGVLGKKEIKESDFFRSYNLDDIGGKIIAKPDEFRLKMDKKKEEQSIMHLGDGANMIVFSSYGEDGKSGRDIYKVVKLPNGDWSDPSSLGDVINTPYDEDFAFLHSDGKTLYFSSKGHNSMGGYDVFKSTLNPGTGAWSPPQNMDFPINTPSDDIFYMTDKTNRFAHFASSRSSKQKELTVYQVKVSPDPPGSLIKGVFLAEENPDMKSASITVMNESGDRKYGLYKTNKKGEYIIPFSGNGGRFKLLVETTEDAPIHAAVIELPRLENKQALKQELTIVGTGNDEKLVVKNLFNETEEFDISDPLVLQQIIRQKARLDVNTTREEVFASLENQKKQDVNQETVETTSKYAKLSDQELLDDANAMAFELSQQAKTSREQANYTFQLAGQKSEEAKRMHQQSQESTGEQAGELKMKATQLSNEAVTALNLAKMLENEATERESDVTKIEKLNDLVAMKISTGDREGANSSMEELDKIKGASYFQLSAMEEEQKLRSGNLREKEVAYSAARNEKLEFLNRQVAAEEKEKELKRKKEATKKKKDIADIEEQLVTLEIDKEDIAYDLSIASKNEAEAKEAYIKAKNDYTSFKTVFDDVGDNRSTEPLADAKKISLDGDAAYFEQEDLLGNYVDDEVISTGEEPVAAGDGAEELAVEENIENASVPDEVDIASSDETNEGNVTEEVVVDTSPSEEDNTAQEEELVVNQEILNEAGEIIDYEAQFNEELSYFDGVEDNYDTYLSKAQIHTKWANAVEQELLLKKIELSGASDEDKAALETEVDELEFTLIEHQEFVQMYKTQAKMLEPESTVAVAGNNNVDNNQELTDETEVVINEEQAQPEETIEYANEQVNDEPEVEVSSQIGNMDDVVYDGEERVAFNYDNSYGYRNELSSDNLNTASELKGEVQKLEMLLEQKLRDLETVDNIEERGKIVDETNILVEQSQQKQLQIDRIYQEENAVEFQNGSAILKEVEQLNTDKYADNALMATMLKDEASTFYKQSIEKRKEAVGAQSYDLKKDLLNEAYDLEMKAIDNQNKALDLYKQDVDVALVTEIETRYNDRNINIDPGTLAIENESTATTNQGSTSANAVPDDELADVQGDNVTKRNEANSSKSSKSKAIYEPVAIALPSHQKEYEGKVLERKASELEDAADRLAEKAISAKKRKERKRLIAEADALMEEAARLRKEAEVYYAEADQERSKETDIAQDIAINRKELGTESFTSSDETLLLDLPAYEVSQTKEQQDYLLYAGMKKDMRRLIKEAEVEYIQADKLEKEIQTDVNKRDDLIYELDEVEDEEEALTIQAQIDDLNASIEEKEQRIRKMRKSATDKEVLAADKNNEATSILINADPTTSKKIAAIERAEVYEEAFLASITDQARPPQPQSQPEETEVVAIEEEEPVLAFEDETNNVPVTPERVVQEQFVIEEVKVETVPEKIDEVPQVLKESIFVMTDEKKASYSAVKRIPVAKKLPEGLVFKVQIGAFRNPIPQDHFKGFAPIMAEKTGTGITRYTAGLFKSFEVADDAKRAIRTLGYPDAFVVSFLNGKRISVAEARNLIASSTELAANNGVNSEATNEPSAQREIPTTEIETGQNVQKIKSGKDFDILFKVKLGEYNEDVPVDDVAIFLKFMNKGIGNYYENGKTIYTIGSFSEYDEAVSLQEEMRQAGIQSPEVAAFKKGQPIALNEALEQLK